MATITEVADRIRHKFDLPPAAALSTAQVYWAQIRYVDDDQRIPPHEVAEDQDVTDADADFIDESTRRELEAEGLL